MTEAQKRYRQSEKWKESRKAADKKYLTSTKGKATMRRYAQSVKGRSAHKRYCLENPEKRSAKNKIAHLTRNGQLVRQPCSICGEPNAQAHHPNYDKPLEVVWLCQCHHFEVHLKQRELKLEQAKEQAKYERLKKKYQEWI